MAQRWGYSCWTKPNEWAGYASVLMCLRKAKKSCAAAARKMSEKNKPADTKVSEGGREEMLQVLEKIPCNPWRRPWWHTLSCSPWCTTSEQIYTLHCVGRPRTAADGYMLKENAAHGEPTQKQHPTKICSLWRGARAGAGIVAETAAHGGTVLEQCIPKRMQPMV